ncbi:MAG TPA: hypothetical protein DEF42_11465 [Desulfosporosinus sp.]|nr:hypothetical protein [Desulfosporosinus sp.]
MKKREVFIIAILCLSLWFNFTTLNKVEEQRKQIDYSISLLNQLNNLLTHTSNQMNQIAVEKEWIQSANFSLVSKESREDRMVVRGEFTFLELKANQKPTIFYREKDTTEWTKEVLDSLGGLNYAVVVTLSPEKHYEYQISAEGDISKGSTVLTIPQKIYGFPEKKIDITFLPVKNSSTLSAQVYVGFAPAPIEAMTPVKVSIQIENEGKLTRTVPLTLKSGLNSEFSGTWEQNKQEMSSNTEFVTVTEFKNGVIIKEKTNTIIHEGNRASQRIISEEKEVISGS